MLGEDVRYGIRMLRKNPGFTAVTILTLAVGIGANTAMFSVVDTVLLRPLPFKNSDRVVVVWEKPPQGRRNSVSAANFLDWREQNHCFERICALTFRDMNLSGREMPERLTGQKVSWDFFEMLGVRPLLGRGFIADDDRPGAPKVVVISHALYKRKFGASPSMVGQAVTLDGERTTIAGVLAPGFRFAGNAELFAPLQLDRAKVTRDFHFLIPLARLKDGLSFAQAQAEMSGIGKNIERAYPKSNKGWGVYVEPMHEALVEDQRRSMLVLFGAVAFVLLIGCVNVANLLLAKAAVRQRELGIRASLGAGRARLFRQMLTESVLLAVTGGAVGLALAFWVVRLMRSLLPPMFVTAFDELAVDWRVLLFTLAVSLATGVLFGILPAWRASNLNLHDILKESGRGASGGAGGTRFRGALVAAEVALSLVLLVSAGLMVRSLAAMQGVDPGFRPDRLLTMRLSMPAARYPDAAQVRSVFRQALEAVRGLPGVRAATICTALPLQGTYFGMPFQIQKHAPVPVSERPGAPYQLVGPDFFQTLAIPLRRGRFFTERDDEHGPPVAIVNESFVKRFMAKEEPLGQRLLVEAIISGKQELGPAIPWEIVGVVADAKFGGLNDDDTPQIYVPVMQSTWPGSTLAVRTASDPMRMSQAVRAALLSVDRDMPVTSVKSMDQIVEESTTQSRTQTWLIGSFAAVALLLAALGIYGVISYAVAQGTHDMGIRMALGAQASDVLGLVLRKGMLLAAVGLAVGLAGAFALTRVMSSMLFGVKATDPWTFAAVSVLLAATAAAATYIPARRATRIDPVVALRFE